MNFSAGPKVGVSIDVDNLLISFAEAGEIPGFKEGLKKKPKDLSWLGKFSIKAGFENSFDWIKTFGQILFVHFYFGRSQIMKDELWHDLWLKYKDEFLIESIYCPRKKPDIREKPDNVDAHLIEHSRRMVNSYVDPCGDKADCFCLMSGDSDYRPLIWQLRKKEIKIAFVLGSEKSFSGVYRDIQVAGMHPVTGEELVHYFAPRRPEKNMAEK